MRNTPYLVQRLILRETPDDCSTGVDRHFYMDYMGAAEFEYGALGESLREMRKEMRTSPYAISIIQSQLRDAKHDPYKAFYVGPASRIEMARAFFDREIDEKTCGTLDRDLKERTEIHITYSTKKAASRNIAGWWCIDRDIPFVLFHQRKDAQTWLACLQT